MRKLLARLEINLEGPHHARVIAWEKPRRGVRVNPQEHPVKVLRTAQILDLSQPLAQLRIRFRTFEKRLPERP